MNRFVDLKAGALRHRVKIEAPVNTLDAAGDWTNDPNASASWALVREVYGGFEYIQGRELEQVAQKWADVRIKWTLRYQQDIALQNNYRLNWNGQFFEIVDIEDVDGRQRAWCAYCRIWQA